MSCKQPRPVALAVIRAAAFLTMAFFIFRHLRNKRPLSFCGTSASFCEFSDSNRLVPDSHLI
jgi:hypothetical protein